MHACQRRHVQERSIRFTRVHGRSKMPVRRYFISQSCIYLASNTYRHYKRISPKNNNKPAPPASLKCTTTKKREGNLRIGSFRVTETTTRKEYLKGQLHAVSPTMFHIGIIRCVHIRYTFHFLILCAPHHHHIPATLFSKV